MGIQRSCGCRAARANVTWCAHFASVGAHIWIVTRTAADAARQNIKVESCTGAEVSRWTWSGVGALFRTVRSIQAFRINVSSVGRAVVALGTVFRLACLLWTEGAWGAGELFYWALRTCIASIAGNWPVRSFLAEVSLRTGNALCNVCCTSYAVVGASWARDWLSFHSDFWAIMTCGTPVFTIVVNSTDCAIASSWTRHTVCRFARSFPRVVGTDPAWNRLSRESRAYVTFWTSPRNTIIDNTVVSSNTWLAECLVSSAYSSIIETLGASSRQGCCCNAVMARRAYFRTVTCRDCSEITEIPSIADTLLQT